MFSALVAFILTLLALLADGRHHRAVLRCVRHSSALKEDTDCVLSENPRGIDRLWERRRRWSFEIQGASLQLVMSNPVARSRVVRKELNTSDTERIHQALDAMSFQLLGHHEQQRRLFLRPRRSYPRTLTASVLVVDDAGQRHVLHHFDNPERAAKALRTVHAYLEKREDTTLSLRYDDSAADEILSALCVAVFLWFALFQGAYERVTVGKIVRVIRRNLIGVRIFDFHCPCDRVAAVHLREYSAEAEKRLFGLKLTLLPPDDQYSPRSSENAPPVSSSKLMQLDVDLCFGDKFVDSAQLKRVAEAANSTLMDLQEHSSGDSDQLCSVCHARPRDTVLFPCRHLHVCRACASILVDCPICRTPIREKHVIFL